MRESDRTKPPDSFLDKYGGSAAKVLELIMVRDHEAVIAGTSEEERRAETMVALGQE